jgi:hypothetical protein
MSTVSIVRGGAAAFQAPAFMIEAPLYAPMSGSAYRVLYWLLWFMHSQELWPTHDDDPEDLPMRLCGREMLEGAGLAGHRGYSILRESLNELKGNGLLGRLDDGHVRIVSGLIASYKERPGPHFDIIVPEALAQINRRPLKRYGLLNLDHIRQLRQPLDYELYARACGVARARVPRFELYLRDVAAISGNRSQDWASLRRPFFGACSRIGAATGCQFFGTYSRRLQRSS